MYFQGLSKAFDEVFNKVFNEERIERISKMKKRNVYILILVITAIIWLFLYNYKPSSGFVEVEATIKDYGIRDELWRRRDKSLHLYTHIRYVYNGHKLGLYEYDEYKFGWSKGDKIKIYVNPKNILHVYTTRYHRRFLGYCCIIVCFITHAIFTRVDKRMKEKEI
ncbi:MAG: hypothetical protein E7262_02990 [Lachnospiraceae bacterium]|nr:hypothetical protein [Lachnospiraceae bacterium]